MRTLMVLIGILFFAATGAHAQTASADVAGGELYTLQPGDTIEVQVLEDTSLNRTLLVQPDGRISFPLVGVVEAGGKTPGELQQTLRSRLAQDFLEPPTVTVSLTSTPEIERDRAAAAESFHILGQVGQPGRFPLVKPISVVEALALAGGPGVFAAESRIQVRSRSADGVETVRLFDYEALEEGRVIPEMIEIRDGDVIFVPESGIFE